MSKYTEIELKGEARDDYIRSRFPERQCADMDQRVAIEPDLSYKQAEIQEYINDNIEYFIDDCDDVQDLHHQMFNQDYYIIGTYEAKKWLGDRAFDVIGVIKDYEEDNFGEAFTDLSEPEKVVNMYTYIVGEHLLNEMSEKDHIFPGGGSPVGIVWSSEKDQLSKLVTK